MAFADFHGVNTPTGQILSYQLEATEPGVGTRRAQLTLRSQWGQLQPTAGLEGIQWKNWGLWGGLNSSGKDSMAWTNREAADVEESVAWLALEAV